MEAIFIRATDVVDKESRVRQALSAEQNSPARFLIDTKDLRQVPGSPFAYWTTDVFRQLFATHPALQSDDRIACFGLSTKDDFRFVRCVWEVPGDMEAGWKPFNKGGDFSPYYADIHLALRWFSDGAELKAFADQRTKELFGSASWSRWINNVNHYGRPGITWPLRTNRLSFRAMPSGCIFASKGPALLVKGDAAHDLLPLLAVALSSVFFELVAVSLNAAETAARSFEVGIIQAVPLAAYAGAEKEELAYLAHHGWRLMYSLDTTIESSHAFLRPALLQSPVGRLRTRSQTWTACAQSTTRELVHLQEQIDSVCLRLYGIDAADLQAVGEGFELSTSSLDSGVSVVDDADDGEHAQDSDTPDGDQLRLVFELISWCVGVVFGRFDVRLATGEQAAPPEPGPFDPLPVCSPGMLAGEDGLPVDTPPGGYPIVWPVDGLLVDDPGHPRDLTSAVREVFDVVFGADADALWVEAAELVDPRGRDIRRWLAKSFFPEHVKRYSKSRRKAPIYWQLGTPSGSYSVWLYAHRVGRDSLYQVLNDLVAPKLQAEERKLTALRQEAGPNPTAGQRKELAAQETLVEELRVLRDEVARVAPLWSPDLNDGVVIVMAPVWRLVPQHKPWQKELKTHWYALQAGKYDWAQLAMHLWPERVVPKCATDRSVAIAHDLEEVFWEQDADGKWKTRNLAQAEIDRLMAARTSPAVRDALEHLLSVDTPVANARLPRVGSQT